MKRPPDTLTLLGVETTLHEPSGDYYSCDDDGCMTGVADVRRNSAKNQWFACYSQGGFLIEGPWASSPEEAIRDLERAVVAACAKVRP